MKTIIALTFALVSSASFAADMSSEFQSAVNEATAKNIVVASAEGTMADEHNAAILESTKAWGSCGTASTGPTMSDEYQAAILEAVDFWN